MGDAARETYEQSQARLHKQSEGEIHIDVPKAAEVRPEVYKDVEQILFRGFILLPAEINGVLFVFKSLNHHEFELVRLLSSIQEGQDTPGRFWDLFLAYCVYIVDGANVLADRDHALPKLADTFSKIPPKARQRIVRYISEVNRRSSNAVTLTEAYATEQLSRFKWAQFRGLDITSTSVTGITGTERLGLNWGQLMWRALNTFEDQSNEAEQAWENAKFVGSCMVGSKGLSKVFAHDKARHEKEQNARMARKDAILRHVLLGEPLDAKEAASARIIAPQTVEDLAEQLEHDLRGDKDFHDRVVEAHEERVRQANKERRQHLEDLSQKRDREHQGKNLIGGTGSEGFTKAEVQQRIQRSKQIAAQQAAAQFVHPELSDPRMADHMAKWGLVEPMQAGISQTDRDVSNVVPIPASPKGPGTPFRR